MVLIWRCSVLVWHSFERFVCSLVISLRWLQLQWNQIFDCIFGDISSTRLQVPARWRSLGRLWWQAQLAKVLLQPSVLGGAVVMAAKNEIGWHSPVVGVHIAGGDECAADPRLNSPCFQVSQKDNPQAVEISDSPNRWSSSDCFRPFIWLRLVACYCVNQVAWGILASNQARRNLCEMSWIRARNITFQLVSHQDTDLGDVNPRTQKEKSSNNILDRPHWDQWRQTSHRCSTKSKITTGLATLIVAADSGLACFRLCQYVRSPISQALKLCQHEQGSSIWGTDHHDLNSA